MFDAVDNEGEDAGQDGQRDGDGGDSGSEDDQGTDVPGGKVRVCGLRSELRETHFVSEFRT